MGPRGASSDAGAQRTTRDKYDASVGCSAAKGPGRLRDDRLFSSDDITILVHGKWGFATTGAPCGRMWAGGCCWGAARRGPAHYYNFTHTTRAPRPWAGWVITSVVAKPHFPWTKIVISSDEKRRSSRSLPGPFAAEQPTDASYLSRVVRCAPASDEAPRGPNWQSINRRTRRPKFHDERPATPRCLLALPTEASSFP